MLDLYDVLCRPVDRGGILEWDKQNKKRVKKAHHRYKVIFSDFLLCESFIFVDMGRQERSKISGGLIRSVLLLLLLFFFFSFSHSF